MLNGLEPIIIFNFSKLTTSESESLSKIPIVSSIVSKIGLPPIPIYLSEKLTGLYIESEDKNIDIETTTETLTDGSDPKINQKAIGSSVKINMLAKKGSIGLTLISAMADLIVPKVTSREYSITYLHGAVTIFGGLLHSFSISQIGDNDLYTVTLEISRNSNKTTEKTGPPEVKPVSESVQLTDGVAPTAPVTPPVSGPPPQPAAPPPVSMGPLG
jgi:hypothetical protein